MGFSTVVFEERKSEFVISKRVRVCVIWFCFLPNEFLFFFRFFFSSECAMEISIYLFYVSFVQPFFLFFQSGRSKTKTKSRTREKSRRVSFMFILD